SGSSVSCCAGAPAANASRNGADAATRRNRRLGFAMIYLPHALSWRAGRLRTVHARRLSLLLPASPPGRSAGGCSQPRTPGRADSCRSFFASGGRKFKFLCCRAIRSELVASQGPALLLLFSKGYARTGLRGACATVAIYETGIGNFPQDRSEERRVGKECRCGYSVENKKEKKRYVYGSLTYSE